MADFLSAIPAEYPQLINVYSAPRWRCASALARATHESWRVGTVPRSGIALPGRRRRQSFCPRINPSTASVTSRVVARPPRSGV